MRNEVILAISTCIANYKDFDYIKGVCNVYM